MKVPCCKVQCVGEVTTWGKQFLNDLQVENVIEVAYQSPQDFLTAATAATAPALVFIEHTPDCKKTITKLRAGTRCFYLIWFGRGFSKEDIVFGMENRAYAIFEHARAEDPKVVDMIRKAADNLESSEQFDQVIHSVKSLLLQSEEDDAARPLVTEIKTAVSKLERCVLKNELSGAKATTANVGQEASTPFYKTQDFSDALNTVNDLERTGVLWLRADLPGEEGTVEFIQGKIVSAQTGETRGLKAIFRMFLWDHPKFMFSRRDPQDCFVEEQVNLSIKHLCQEGEELRRRYESIRREVPPGELRIELEPNSLHIGTKLGPQDFSTLASVVEFGKISQVIDNNLLPDVSLYESLIRLKKQNMIRVAMG